MQSIIESLLFMADKPLTARGLAKIIAKPGQDPSDLVPDIEKTLRDMQKQYSSTGIVLLESNQTWQLSSNPKNSALVKDFLNAELREKLTNATIETLAIIAYRQPISKSEIEAIRGVNCQYSLRHLLIRGLIQKTPNPKDARQMMYETTMEFLAHMGLTSNLNLPDFEILAQKVRLPETLHKEETAVKDLNDKPNDEPGD